MSNLLEIPVSRHYVSRTINGIKDIDLFKSINKSKDLREKNTLLLGPTGTAKTSVCREYAAVTKKPYVRVPCAGAIDPASLFGRYVPDPDKEKSFKWIDGIVTQVVREGGVLVLDEVNFLPPKIAVSLFPLLDADRHLVLMDNGGELIKAHDDLIIFGTMNPGYRGTQDLNKAFDNRFGIKILWDYSKEVEKQLLKSPTLVKMAGDIRKTLDTNGSQTPLPTNALMDFEKIALEISLEFAIDNLTQRFYAEKNTTKTAINKTLTTYQGNIRKELFATNEKTKTQEKIVNKKPEINEEFTNLWNIDIGNGVLV